MLRLPRTVVVLGFVSLLNDAASEMITPLLPIFLTAVLGAGPAIVGLIEGVAEATASILKLISGWLADRGLRPKRLVLAGYGTSNVARPLIGLALGWPWVLAMRFLDRVGKGVRTAPRDALIAGAVEPERQGTAFGFHRSMDHAGAVVGPLIAFALLALAVPLDRVFYWSVIPGMLVLLLLALGIRSRVPYAQTLRAQTPAESKSVSLHWKSLESRLRAVLLASAVLAFAAVPEVFVVLWASNAGLDLVWIPLLWAASSGMKMLIAMPSGVLADRIGPMAVLLLGVALRVTALLLLGGLHAKGVAVWGLFLMYSASLAVTEPAERGIVGGDAPPKLRGTAFGLYHLASGLFVLPGALAFGVVWQTFSSADAFVLAAIVNVAAAALFWMVARRPRATVDATA